MERNANNATEEPTMTAARKHTITHPDGTISKRSSKTMAYVCATVIRHDGEWAVISWHQTRKAAEAKMRSVASSHLKHRHVSERDLAANEKACKRQGYDSGLRAYQCSLSGSDCHPGLQIVDVDAVAGAPDTRTMEEKLDGANNTIKVLQSLLATRKATTEMAMRTLRHAQSTGALSCRECGDLATQLGLSLRASA